MKRATLASEAYKHLYDKIVSGELRSGERVSEAAVARQLGISRTPVGEAIQKLVQEGVVEQKQRYGTIVRTLSRNDLIELYETREALEGFAAERVASCLSPEDVTRLHRLCNEIGRIHDRMNEENQSELQGEAMGRFLSVDMAFHMLIIHAAGNQRIEKIIRDTRSLARIFGVKRATHDANRIEAVHAAHSAIVDHLEHGRGPEARQAMIDHIRKSLQESLTTYDLELARSRREGLPPLDLPPDLMEDLDLEGE